MITKMCTGNYFITNGIIRDEAQTIARLTKPAIIPSLIKMIS